MTSPGVISAIAGSIGAEEAALRLMLSLMFGYPVAIAHRKHLRNQPKEIQHLFFILAGIGMGYFNFGAQVLHFVICTVVLYLTLLVAGGTVASVVFSFVFQMGYLIVGYVFSQTDGYDVNWSTPHCVLTLKLIAIAFDMFDGHKDKAELREDQKETALSSRPSVLEVAGHAFFPSAMIVGPQFSLRRYQQFTDGQVKYAADENGEADSVKPALIRLALGWTYILLHQALYTLVVPDEYFYSQQFQDLGFFQRMFWIGIWVKVVFMRYAAAWLIAEGGCILIGLTYNGRDGQGNHLWDGLANIRIRIYENATKFQVYPSAFNVNTNAWVAKYVYKRLRFLGNRYYSQFLTLMFLAVWHGYHLGYFVLFFMEFIIILWERKVESALLQYPAFVSLCTESWLRFPVQLVLRLYTVVFLGYSCIPFVAVVRRRWWPLFKSVYLCGHLIFLTWPLVVPAIHHAMRLCGVKRVRPQRAAEPAAESAAAAAPAAAAAASKPAEAAVKSEPEAAPAGSEAKKEL